ncbi:kinase phosphorylation protein [Toxoplasma gondii VAND]|uniref:Kinase phosphorylation protein n=1 Tax=Toxoplasma gondii VAND TaxID=933077 RepID=A0A086PUG0_TOXGO|nr:kinase phosphorylation protein [Toxoplasma gondii VAND]
MAVYIRQSPPREGVRGGREDFKWNSLTTSQDYDYYLGASVKIGLHSRGGKFVKHDWWTKQRGGTTGDLDEEMQRVKHFEDQLMGEALGQKPKNLLVGNPYEECEALGDGADLREKAAGGDSEERPKRKKQKKEKKKKKEKRRREKKRKSGRRSSSSSSSSSSLSLSPRRLHSAERRERRDRKARSDLCDARIKREGFCMERRQPSGDTVQHAAVQARRYESPDADRRHREAERSRREDRFGGERDRRHREAERSRREDRVGGERDRRHSECREKDSRSPGRDRRRTDRDRGSVSSERRHERAATGRCRSRNTEHETPRDSWSRRSALSPDGRQWSSQFSRDDEQRRLSGTSSVEYPHHSRYFDGDRKASGLRERDAEDSDSRSRKRRR